MWWSQTFCLFRHVPGHHTSVQGCTLYCKMYWSVVKHPYVLQYKWLVLIFVYFIRVNIYLSCNVLLYFLCWLLKQSFIIIIQYFFFLLRSRQKKKEAWSLWLLISPYTVITEALFVRSGSQWFCLSEAINLTKIKHRQQEASAVRVEKLQNLLYQSLIQSKV